MGLSNDDLHARALAPLIQQHRRQAIRDAINAFQATLTDEELEEERRLSEDVQRASARTIRDAIDRGTL